MPPFREAPQTCTVCQRLAEATCIRCGCDLCETHRPRTRRRCDACEEEFETSLAKLEARPVVIRSRTWKNVPLDAAVLVLFVLCVPALIVIDLVFFAAVLGIFGELWPFEVVRSGYPWLRSKERRMWSRRTKQLRKQFLRERPRLSSGASRRDALGTGSS